MNHSKLKSSNLTKSANAIICSNTESMQIWCKKKWLTTKLFLGPLGILVSKIQNEHTQTNHIQRTTFSVKPNIVHLFRIPSATHPTSTWTLCNVQCAKEACPMIFCMSRQIDLRRDSSHWKSISLMVDRFIEVHRYQIIR